MNPDFPCDLVIRGAGAVSPAGWGLAAAHDALQAGTPLPTVAVPGVAGGRARRVPEWKVKPDWLRQPRLRRASAASRFAISAALEALKAEGTEFGAGAESKFPRLGVIAVVMNAAVQYSGRFYGEVLADPATASPILFPETVFNAPGSHLCSLLGADGPSATLVGDGAAQTAAALELAQLWLAEQAELDGVLLVSMEEADPLTAAGLALLDPQRISAEGAAALWLGRAGTAGVKIAELEEVSALDAAELRPVVQRWVEERAAAGANLEAALGANPGATTDRLLRGGGNTLARERVLAALDDAQTAWPQAVFGDLFAVNATLSLALGFALLTADQHSAAVSAVTIAEAGGWHGAFRARLTRG